MASWSADIDPTNPNGSLSLAAGADALTRSVKELDVMSSNSDFRKALGRIDPDHKIGTFLEDNKQTIAIVAAVALCAYGGYYLVSSGAVTGEAAFLVEVGGQSVKVASAHFASAGAGAAGGAGAFIATGGIAQAGPEPRDDTGYESGSGITSVVEGSSGSGSRPSDTPKASENQLLGQYKNGRKKTTKGHNVGGQDHVLDVMTRIARLSSLDPKLFQNGINPDILTKLNKMVKDGNIDPLLLKELREALDTLGKKILSIDAALAGDIDDLADTIAMQSEYGLGVPLTSEIRKMSPGQQDALVDRQLSASQKFIDERLEEDDGRSARIESLQFMAVAGMFKAYQDFDEFNQLRAFYTQRALDFTFEFANFAIDFTGVPAMLKSAYEYSEAQPRDPKTGAPIYGTENSMDFAIDLLSILAPKWLRKGGKSADIFQDFKRHVNGTSDGGKFLNEGLSAADELYDDLLKSGVRAEDLADVVDSARSIGLKSADDISSFANLSSEFGKKVAEVADAVNSGRGKIGEEFEQHLVAKFGGQSPFKSRGREFDGAVRNAWYEAKSGRYWEDIYSANPNKFKEDMGDRLRIALDNGKSYHLISNTPIPQEVKNWLIKKSITFVELSN